MAASLLVIKQFTYKGSLEEWGNRYHFSGGAPADDAHWLTFDSAVRTAEKAILNVQTSIVRTLGYEADDEPSVWARTATTVGTLAPSTSQIMPGDVAASIRYSTARRDSRGHPVYLRNYYHGGFRSTSGDLDTLIAAYKTALETYGSAWVAGFSDGTVTHPRTGPDSLGATGTFVSPFFGRRKLKRRG